MDTNDEKKQVPVKTRQEYRDEAVQCLSNSEELSTASLRRMASYWQARAIVLSNLALSDPTEETPGTDTVTALPVALVSELDKEFATRGIEKSDLHNPDLWEAYEEARLCALTLASEVTK